MQQRSMLPREHGAYGQLAFPLASALIAGGSTVSAIAMSTGAAALFIAHEPLLVLLGQRGARALREDRKRAVRWLAGAGGVAAVLGVAGLWLAPEAARLASLAPLALTIPVGALVARRAEKSLAGELLASTSLSAVGLPVGLATGLDLRSAAWIAACWAICFGLATIAVRHIIAASRGAGGIAWSPLLAAAAGGATVTFAATGVSSWAAVASLSPVVGFVLLLGLVRPHARHLKRVGWSLVAASTLTLVALVLALRSLPMGS
jgi:hypothetical protein